jgi:AraC-like DNA-binding protein
VSIRIEKAILDRQGILNMNCPTTHSWAVPEIPDLECFRAVGFRHEYPRHCHATWAIGVVDHGRGGIWYRGAHERGGAGELITLNPGEVHTGYPLEKQGLSYSMLYLGNALVRDVLPDVIRLPIFPALVRDPVLALRLRRLCRLLEFGGPSLAVETRLLTDVRCLFVRHARVEERQRLGSEPGHVAQIQEFLRSNLHRNVRLDELQHLTGLSKAYLIRSFRRLVGMPPYEWLLQLRIEKAKNRLQQGCPIRDLAIELGFADQSHFHRRFKSITGVTPAAFVAGHYRSRQETAGSR